MTKRRFGVAMGVITFLATAGLIAGYRALLPPSLPVPDRFDGTLTGLTLIEAGEPARANAWVRMHSGRLEAVGFGDGGSSDGATTIDRTWSGLYAMPGLVDMHVHYPPGIAVGNAELWSLLFLAHGVTTLREVGSIDGGIFAIRRAIESGAYPGPRIYACGPILDGAPPAFPSNRVIRSPSEARAAVVDAAERGADCVKVYNMLGRECFEEVVRTARERGLPVVGHKPHDVPFEDAAIDDLQHGTGAVPVDVARVGRFDFRSEDWSAMDAARIAYAVERYREGSIAHTPTLFNPRMRLWLTEPGDLSDDTGLVHLPRFWEGVWGALWSAPFATDDVASRAIHAHFRERAAELTRALHGGGVTVHAGTDTLMPYVAPGSSLWGELEELIAAGIPPEDVLAIATRAPAHALGQPALGRWAPGAPADWVLLRDDPRRGPDAFKSIEAVVADGRIYPRSELDRALARFDAHFQGVYYSAVMGGLTAVVRDAFAPEAGASGHDPHGGGALAVFSE